MRSPSLVRAHLLRVVLGIAVTGGAALAIGGCYAEEDAYVNADSEVGIQPQIAITSVDDFYPVMAPYGSWYDTDVYGAAWCPSGISAGWTPYSTGHWLYTQYGWTFVGDQPWGWAAYHYGRWVPNIGACSWAWIPDIEWGPAWVEWRTWGGYTAWSPMQPSSGHVVHFGPTVTNTPNSGGVTGLPKVVVQPPTVATGGASGAPSIGSDNSNRWNVVANGDLAAPNLGGRVVHPGDPLPPANTVGNYNGGYNIDRPGGAGVAQAPSYGGPTHSGGYSNGGYNGSYGSPSSGWGSANRAPSPSYTTPSFGSSSNGGSYRGGYSASPSVAPAPHFSSPSVGGGSVGGGFHGGSVGPR